MNVETKKPHTALNDALLSSFAAGWRAKGRAESTVKEYVRHLRRVAATLDGSFLDATRTHLEAHISAEMQRTSAATAAYITRAVRSFYAWLLEEGEVEVNPAARLKTPKVPEPVMKIAAAEDVAKMVATCKPGKMFASFNDRRDLALIHMLRSGGLRIAEAARVELHDTNLTDGFIIIPITKTGKPRVAPLDPLAMRAISAYVRRLDQDDTGCVWRMQNGKHLRLAGVKQIMERRAKRAGVDVSPHQFRRAFAGDYMRRGGSQTALQALAGWSSPRMVDRYLGAHRTEIALAEFQRLYAS
jgi:site-specific recombinase XerD